MFQYLFAEAVRKLSALFKNRFVSWFFSQMFEICCTKISVFAPLLLLLLLFLSFLLLVLWGIGGNRSTHSFITGKHPNCCRWKSLSSTHAHTHAHTEVKAKSVSRDSRLHPPTPPPTTPTSTPCEHRQQQTRQAAEGYTQCSIQLCCACPSSYLLPPFPTHHCVVCSVLFSAEVAAVTLAQQQQQKQQRQQQRSATV